MEIMVVGGAIGAIIMTRMVLRFVTTFWGDTPKARLLKLVGGIIAFFGYIYAVYGACVAWAKSKPSGAPIGALILLALPLVLLAISYIMDGKSE